MEHEIMGSGLELIGDILTPMETKEAVHFCL